MQKTLQIVIDNSNSLQITMAVPQALPPRMHTELKEYSRRRGTEYPYNDDLNVDVLIIGAGFGILPPRGLLRSLANSFRRRLLFENTPRARSESYHL